MSNEKWYFLTKRFTCPELILFDNWLHYKCSLCVKKFFLNVWIILFLQYLSDNFILRNMIRKKVTPFNLFPVQYPLFFNECLYCCVHQWIVLVCNIKTQLSMYSYGTGQLYCDLDRQEVAMVQSVINNLIIDYPYLANKITSKFIKDFL